MGRFLLGVGCQKGGTSWIHDYLWHHPQADMGPRKEWHVLDALFVPELRKPRYDRVILQVLRHASAPSASELPAGLVSVAASLLDLSQYFDQFHYRLLRDPSRRLVGDITPSYAALPVEAFELVRDGFAARGVEVRVLFVLRDPVERCWSQVRMMRRDNPDAAFPPSEAEHLRRAHTTWAHQVRTRYDQTLARLEAVFPPEALHVALYEQLLTPEGIAALCRFLDLDPAAPDLDRRVFASPKTAALPDDVAGEVATRFAPVYEDARRRFGADVIARCWPSDRLVQPAYVA